jgi:hypothetical protein
MAGTKRRATTRRGPNPIDYGDLPRVELMRRAQIAYRIGWDVRFKFTCATCGTRCAFADLNMLWTQGECSSCGRNTTVVRGGFMLQTFRLTQAMKDWMVSPEEVRFADAPIPLTS